MKDDSSFLEEKLVYSLPEIAAFLRCHEETLRRAIRVGELKAAKIGRGYVVSRKALEDYFQKKGGGQLFSVCTQSIGTGDK